MTDNSRNEAARDELQRLLDMSVDEMGDDPDALFADFDRLQDEAAQEASAKSATARQPAAEPAANVFGNVDEAEAAAARRERQIRTHEAIEEATFGDHIDGAFIAPIPRLDYEPVTPEPTVHADAASTPNPAAADTDFAAQPQGDGDDGYGGTFEASSDPIGAMFGLGSRDPNAPLPAFDPALETGRAGAAEVAADTHGGADTDRGPASASTPPVEVDPAPGEPEPGAASEVPAEPATAGMMTKAEDQGFTSKSAAVLTSWWTKFRGLRKQGQILIGLGLLAVIMVLISMCSGGSKDEPNAAAPVPSAEPMQTEAASPSSTTASASSALVPDSVESDCPRGSTRPELAFTNERSDAWVCARTLGIDGAVMTVKFKRPVVISEITVIPGFNYVESSGIDQWTRHRVVSRILWRIGDEQIVQNINPTRTGATLKVNAIATQTVTLVVQSTADASGRTGVPVKKSGDSFAVSSIKFTGHEA